MKKFTLDEINEKLNKINILTDFINQYDKMYLITGIQIKTQGKNENEIINTNKVLSTLDLNNALKPLIEKIKIKRSILMAELQIDENRKRHDTTDTKQLVN